jgi:hypothetical protein
LFESLSAEERRLYPFDVTSFDWRTYFLNSHLPGLFRLAARLGLDAGAVIRNDGAAEASEGAFALPGRPMGFEGSANSHPLLPSVPGASGVGLGG